MSSFLIFLSAYTILLPQDGVQQDPPVSPEIQAYLERVGDIADHGRPPEEVRLDFSGICEGERYRIVISSGHYNGERLRPILEILEQPNRAPSIGDRQQIQATLDRFSSVYSVSLHCWRNAGYRYFITGMSDTEQLPPAEKAVAILFDGEGHLDRVVD